MKIKNIHDLAECYDTNRIHLEEVLSGMAHRKISILPYPTHVCISTELGECSTDFSITCRYPFESSAVDTFIENIDRICTDAYHAAFDDPIEMLMNMTDPGEGWTVEDAGHILSEAEAQGWHLDPTLTPEDILAMYNDLEPEEEEE